MNMFSNQHEEHLAHSAPCNSRWDDFDRGTVWADEVPQRTIGRMTSEAGYRVEIVQDDSPRETEYHVFVNGRVVFTGNDRAGAVRVARWWMDGCPA